MPIPASKADLITAIRTDYARLCAELDRIPTAQGRSLTMPGHAAGTEMSPCDLLAYLTGWGQLVLKWAQAHTTGNVPDYPETGYTWTELGPLAGSFYARYAHHDLPTLRALLDITVQDILSFTQSCPETYLYGSTTWYKQYTPGRMIQLNTTSPFKNARLRLRKRLKNPA